MNIIAETRENIENWLDRKQRKTYKRMKGDNYQGYVYQLTLPDPNMDCAAVIRLTDLNMLVLELYSGIRVLDPVLMAPVALYCQQWVKTGFGGVIAEELSGCITYRVETVFRENAVSEETLELYEEEAIHTISTHYENLKALASGRFLSLEEPVEVAHAAEKKVDQAAVVSAIRTYLESEDRNIRAENLNAEDANKFLCGIRVGGKHLMVNYAVSDCGILMENMTDCATAVERLSSGLLPSDGSQERDLRQHLKMLSDKLLGNVLGDLPFGDDSDDEEEICGAGPDINAEDNDANDNDTEDDVTMDDWLKQLALPDPTPEAG